MQADPLGILLKPTEPQRILVSGGVKLPSLQKRRINQLYVYGDSNPSVNIDLYGEGPITAGICEASGTAASWWASSDSAQELSDLLDPLYDQLDRIHRRQNSPSCSASEQIQLRKIENELRRDILKIIKDYGDSNNSYNTFWKGFITSTAVCGAVFFTPTP